MAASNLATTERVDTGLVPVPTAEDEIASLRATLDTLTQRVAGTARDAANGAPANRRRGQRNERTTEMNAPATAPVTAAVTSQPTQALPGSNVMTFASLMDVAKDLGTQAGQGKDTQVKFDLKVLEAAYLGVIDQQPNKHGQERSDSVVLSEQYVKAQQGAVIFDAKAPNQRKLISNVGKMIKLGSNPKWGQGQPMQNVNDLITLRQNIKKQATKGIKVDDAHNSLMRYATQQLKEDTLIVGDALKAFCVKGESEPRSAEDVFRAIQKMASNLKNGKVANCPDTDTSPQIATIINACNARVTALVKARSGQ